MSNTSTTAGNVGALTVDGRPTSSVADVSTTKAANQSTDVAAFLRVLHRPGDVFEIRVPKCPEKRGGRYTSTVAGYCNAAEPAELAVRQSELLEPPGVYVTLNPVNPALLARSVNTIKHKAESTTTDADILCRSHLMLDLDPKRPAGVSSTEKEMQAALELAQRMQAELAAEGWPRPIVGMSGNGAYLLYPINLPNDAPATDLVKRVLAGLAERFDNDQVTVDTSTFNAARIIKLLGTVARKGSHLEGVAGVEDRPHRRSWFIPPAGDLQVVSEAQLQAVAATAKPVATEAPNASHHSDRAARGDSAVERCRKYIAKMKRAVQGEKGSKAVFAAACKCFEFGLTDTEAAELLTEWNTSHCDPPFSESELEHKLVDAKKKVEAAGKFGSRRNSQRSRRAPEQGGEDDGDEKQSQATVLVNLAQEAGVEFWHTPAGDAFATVPVNEHREHHRVTSKAFRSWLSRLYYQECGRAPNSQAKQDAIGVLEGIATHDGDVYPVFVRTSEHDGKIYLDLADDDWRCVQVDADGWRIIDEPPVRFRRPKALLPLPSPVSGGSLGELRRYINVKESHWPLVVAWLVAAVRPIGPYPALSLSGEQGSGKSTQAEMLRELIDPNEANLRASAREPRDLMIAANNGHVVTLDNLSSLPDWLSDCLCRLATGGGFSTRTLFENDEETIFQAMRPVILNGIEEVASRGDLLERSLTIVLPTISEHARRPEAELWRDFEQARPRILGALLTAISVAMRNLPTVKLKTLPRMADFACWVVAAEPALDIPAGSFLAAYAGNRDETTAMALESSLVVAPLMVVLEKENGWSGTVKELLAEIDDSAGYGDDSKRQKPRRWPTTAKALAGELRRLAPNLRKAGWEVVIGGRTRSGVIVDIEQVGETRSQSSQRTPSPENTGITAENAVNIPVNMVNVDAEHVHTDVHTENPGFDSSGEHREHREHCLQPQSTGRNGTPERERVVL